MTYSIIKSASLAVALLLCASVSLAADSKSGTAAETKSSSTPKAADGNSKASAAKTAKNAKRVDINSAGKAELKKLPAIGDAEADKIIAGRPYLSKAHLATQNIIPAGVYEGVKNLVIAKQNKATAAKLHELEKKR